MWIDIAIIVLVVIYACVGLYRGFFDSLLKVIGSIGALLIGIFGAKPTLGFLDNIFHFRTGLGDACLNALSGSIDSSLLDKTLTPENLEVIKASLNEGGLTLPERLMNHILETSTIDPTMTFGTLMSTTLGTIFGCIIVGFALFLLIKLLVFILAKIFDSKEKRSLSGMNRTLGLFFGAIKGCVFVVLVYTVLAVTCMITPIQPQLDELKNDTSVFKNTYDPYAEVVQTFVEDKMGTFIENLSNNLKSDK